MFKNHDDYVKQRNEILSRAQEAIEKNDTKAYDAAVAEVNQLDADYAQYAQRKADIDAMKGAVKAPISNGERTNVSDRAVAQDDDFEYRKAFMNYVVNGVKMANSDEYTTTSDVGSVIPNTIINKIIEKLETVGGIYAKMTKTFFKGGVTVPTSSAKPVATWTTERGTTDKQKKPTGSVTFTYHKLRCVVSLSLAVDNVTLDVFERTIAQNIADAMVKAIEYAAFNGTGTNEPKGIFAETAIEAQVINITEGQSPSYDDYLKAEAALPDEYDGAEWYMRKTTFYGKFLSLKDSAGQPIARVNEGVDGKPKASILGRPVNFTDHVPAFASSVTADTPFAVMFDFQYYLFNANLGVTVKEYEDHDTDDQIKKAVMLADGKAIDVNSLVIMQVKNS